MSITTSIKQLISRASRFLTCTPTAEEISIDQVGRMIAAIDTGGHTAPTEIRASFSKAGMSDDNTLHISQVVATQLAKAQSEIERLRHVERAFNEWIERSEWVQTDADGLFYGMAGMHRADCMRLVIERWRAEIAELRSHLTTAAAPAPVAQRLLWALDSKTAQFLANLITANEDEATPVTLSVGYAKNDDGTVEYGLRVHESDYPEEGCSLLVACDLPAAPAPVVDVCDHDFTPSGTYPNGVHHFTCERCGELHPAADVLTGEYERGRRDMAAYVQEHCGALECLEGGLS